MSSQSADAGTERLADGGQVLEPASAFIFFEQQLEELIEDHELGSEIKYWDTNQLPGE